MPALTGTFGQVPDSWRPKRRDVGLNTQDQGLPVLVLCVRVNMGSVQTVPLAVSYDAAILQQVFAKWLAVPGNSQLYVDHEIKRVPLILE